MLVVHCMVLKPPKSKRQLMVWQRCTTAKGYLELSALPFQLLNGTYFAVPPTCGVSHCQSCLQAAGVKEQLALANKELEDAEAAKANGVSPEEVAKLKKDLEVGHVTAVTHPVHFGQKPCKPCSLMSREVSILHHIPGHNHMFRHMYTAQWQGDSTMARGQHNGQGTVQWHPKEWC